MMLFMFLEDVELVGPTWRILWHSLYAVRSPPILFRGNNSEDSWGRPTVVRAKAFDVLQEHLGAKAIDQTIPTLLEALRQPGKGSGTALQALREVMSIRASTVFPVLIPTLTALPMTVFNARALASLVTVAGNALSRRLTIILNALVKTWEDDQDEELQEALDETIRSLFASIADPEGLNTLMLGQKRIPPKRRVSGSKFFAIFCEESELDSSLYRVDWIRQLISSLEDSQVEVHTAAWEALDTFVKSIPKDELEPLVVPLRRSIESTGAPGQTVPGFSLPKGVSPTVPIIIAGLTMGSNEQREQAAYAIGDLVERTESAIKPFVMPFTGPLRPLRAALESCVELVSDAFREIHEDTYTQAIGDLVSSFSESLELLRPIVTSHLDDGAAAT
ncbi:hypothetical protein DXG01_001674 [Tephrocybe rancida]|nr:hypothetical protein DXG01_001674 [Tephrocybe rancida]